MTFTFRCMSLFTWYLTLLEALLGGVGVITLLWQFPYLKRSHLSPTSHKVNLRHYWQMIVPQIEKGLSEVMLKVTSFLQCTEVFGCGTSHRALWASVALRITHNKVPNPQRTPNLCHYTCRSHTYTIQVSMPCCRLVIPGGTRFCRKSYLKNMTILSGHHFASFRFGSMTSPSTMFESSWHSF